MKTSGLQRLRWMWRRCTPGPLLVRAVVFGGAVGALLVAYTPLLVGPSLLDAPSAALGLVAAAGLVALWPALAPRGQATTAVLVLAVGGWLGSTWGGAPGTPISLVAESALLYLLHTSAALAAVLPYDGVVAPGVLARWLARALGVVVVTALFAIVVAAVVQYRAGQEYLVLTLAGLAAAAGLAALLAQAARRR